MNIKITNHLSQPVNTSSVSQTTKTASDSEKTFEDVLVLNQTALKAMTIDAMIAESSTGSISPDAVNAAAIMKFRSTLTNVIAPMPQEDYSTTNSSSQANQNSANTNTTIHENNNINTSINNTPANDTTVQNSNTNTSANDASVSNSNTGTSNSSTPTYNTSIDISDVYNAGSLVCNDELNTYFKEAATTYNVDVKLLKAIAKAESNFNPSDTSRSGAMGIMQLMPATAKGLGVTDAYDARQCIIGGAKYISDKIAMYDGDITLALAAYNAGSGNVKKYGGVPPFTETQNYIKKVLGYYNE